MKSNLKFFRGAKISTVDNFFKNILYNKKFGYYTTRQPFGNKGDFITSPKISSLFSEMVSIWIISTWEKFGKPKIFNVVELGPGDGSLTKVLLRSFKFFPEFNSCKKIYLYEESNYLKKLQKKNISDKNIKWIKNFNNKKKGTVGFIGIASDGSEYRYEIQRRSLKPDQTKILTKLERGDVLNFSELETVKEEHKKRIPTYESISWSFSPRWSD